VILKYKKMKN